MGTFTFFNHGTGGASSKPASSNEIVNLFGNNAVGIEYDDYLITEGVGAIGNPQKQLQTLTHGADGPQVTSQLTSPSEYRSNEVFKQVGAKPVKNILEGLMKMGVKKLLGNDLQDVLLQASGIGVDENVYSGIGVIRTLIAKGKRPDKINMIGWSRGAVTSIRIAYFLSLENDTASIPINIFSIDPVAGKGHDHEIDARTLKENVKNYVATLAVNEDRSSFAPMEFSRLAFGSGTKLAILPLPGVHSDTAKRDQPSGRVAFHLCSTFLETHGTPLSSLAHSYKLSERDLIKEYDALMGSPKSAGVQAGQPFKKRALAGNPISVSRPVDRGAKSPYFVNAHHRLVFGRLFPLLSRSAGSNTPSQNVDFEIQTMRLFGLDNHIARLHDASVDPNDLYLNPLVIAATQANVM